MPVDSKHPLYDERLHDWEDCRLFYDGERAVKAEGERFIPKPEDATKHEYDNYVMRAFFFPAIERTVAGLSGAIDRKDPTVQVTPRIEYLVDNADSEDSSLRQYSKVVLDEVFVTGRCGLFADRDEEGEYPLPYLTLYKAEDIINWVDDKNLGLTLVVLREYYFENDSSDPFVQTQKLRYRVLKLDESGFYTQELWEVDEKGKIYQGVSVIPTRAGKKLNFIPFVFCNVRSITPKIDKPPLLDLVYKNAEHLRVSADYANSLYFTGNPIMWASGVKAPAQRPVVGPHDAHEPAFRLTIGSTRAVLLPKDGKVGMLECSGHGVKPNQERCNDIKLEMAVLGARLLENQRAGVEAAETAQLRQSNETATLSNIVVNVSSAIRKMLQIIDEWEGGDGDPDKIDFQLNNDFVEVVMNPTLLEKLANLVQNELISWDTFYYNLAVGEISVPGRTADEERNLIETQPVMGSASQAMAALDGMMNGINPPVGAQDEKTPQDTDEDQEDDTEEDEEDANKEKTSRKKKPAKDAPDKSS